MPAYKKNQYVLCKYNGHNGDLIVGRIESVRSTGHVVLQNMLTLVTSTKKTSVLQRRNVVVPKQEADKVQKRFNELSKSWGADKQARAATRTLAVQLAARYTDAPKRELAPKKVTATSQVIKAFRDLSKDEQQTVSRALWGEVLSMFGVK